MKLKRKKLFGRFTAFAAALSMIAALPSCGPADQEEFTRTGKVMVIGKANPKEDDFWESVKNGSLDAGDEMGYTVTFESADNESDYQSQIGYINQAIADKYDVIVIAPNSKTELNEALTKASQAGIEIININSQCDFEDVSCLIASSDGAAASSCCDEVVRLMREKNDGKLAGVGKMGIIPHDGDTADTRIKIFKNRLTNQIMVDMQESGQGISGETYNSDSNNSSVILEDGTELLLPEEAANRAAAAAAKSGLKGDDVVNAATQAAEEAVAALKEAGYDSAGNPLGSEEGDGGSGETEEVKDPTADMMTPDEAAEAALEEAKKDPNISPSEYSNIATAAAEKQAQAIAEAKAKAASGGSSQSSGSSQSTQATNADGVPVDINGTPDPAYNMQSPAEAGQAAVDAAKKAGDIPTEQFASIGQKAAQEQAEAIAKARAEAGYIVSDEQKAQEESANKNSTSKNYFQELQNEYFIEGNRCITSFEAFEETLKMLDPDSDGKADDTGIKVLYATNTNTTIGVCQAIEQLGLSDEIIVIGYNADEKELQYVKTGVLDATVLQNPYSVGYLGVIYAKKLVDGNTITKNINTGVTLLTPENLNDDYIQILLYPDKTLAIAENENKKPKEDAEETTTASTEDTNSAEDAAESTNADGGNE